LNYDTPKQGLHKEYRNKALRLEFSQNQQERYSMNLGRVHHAYKDAVIEKKAEFDILLKDRKVFTTHEEQYIRLKLPHACIVYGGANPMGFSYWNIINLLKFHVASEGSPDGHHIGPILEGLEQLYRDAAPQRQLDIFLKKFGKDRDITNADLGSDMLPKSVHYMFDSKMREDTYYDTTKPNPKAIRHLQGMLKIVCCQKEERSKNKVKWGRSKYRIDYYDLPLVARTVNLKRDPYYGKVSIYISGDFKDEQLVNVIDSDMSDKENATITGIK